MKALCVSDAGTPAEEIFAGKSVAQFVLCEVQTKYELHHRKEILRVVLRPKSPLHIQLAYSGRIA
jgi:hypothetical protein